MFICRAFAQPKASLTETMSFTACANAHSVARSYARSARRSRRRHGGGGSESSCCQWDEQTKDILRRSMQAYLEQKANEPPLLLEQGFQSYNLNGVTVYERCGDPVTYISVDRVLQPYRVRPDWGSQHTPRCARCHRVFPIEQLKKRNSGKLKCAMCVGKPSFRL